MKSEAEASSEFSSSEADEKLAEAVTGVGAAMEQEPGTSGGSQKKKKSKKEKNKNGKKRKNSKDNGKKKRRRRGGIKSDPIKVLTHPLDRSIAFVFVVTLFFTI